MTDEIDPRARDLLRERQKAFCLAFGQPGTPGFEAFKDLADFCRAFGPVGFEEFQDARHHARVEGRREAFWRIFQHLHLDIDQLADIYGALRHRGSQR